MLVAILRNIGNTVIHRVLRRVDMHLFAFEPDLSALRPVKEYGIAYLHGKTIRERAEALISIAHPKFRDSLFEYCERTKFLQRNHVAVAVAD